MVHIVVHIQASNCLAAAFGRTPRGKMCVRPPLHRDDKRVLFDIARLDTSSQGLKHPLSRFLLLSFTVSFQCWGPHNECLTSQSPHPPHAETGPTSLMTGQKLARCVYLRASRSRTSINDLGILSIGKWSSGERDHHQRGLRLHGKPVWPIGLQGFSQKVLRLS